MCWRVQYLYDCFTFTPRVPVAEYEKTTGIRYLLHEPTPPESTQFNSVLKRETMSCDNKLPPWEKPSPSAITHDVGLNIMNSLTRSKDKFITMDGGKQIRWYM